jgi:hydrogenase maturation protease
VKILVLGLGNELLADDAVGLLIIRELTKQYKGQAELVECTVSGLALLEYFIDFEKAIIVDAIHTGKKPAGTIYELIPSDLGEIYAPSPHYTGLPEMMALARQLELQFPEDIKIFAMEIADPYTIGGPLTESVSNAMEGLIMIILKQLSDWESVG